ncbi:MAG: hypothetical protein K0A92_09125 [Methyloprofundus sp.]|nr:hypothetical protein [Methyloprofundus sp.]
MPLAEYQKLIASRNEAIISAYATGEYSYQQIADFFELHFTSIGKIIRAASSEKSYKSRPDPSAPENYY